jgi:1-phosphofructokinase/tagatose 6-phosphate kinase
MNNLYYLSICLNPVLQKTIVLPNFTENDINRSKEYYFDASGKGINCSRVLTQLKEKVMHLTIAGGLNKKLFLRKAKKDKIKIFWINSKSEIRYCYTIINKKNKTITEIIEEAEQVDKNAEQLVYKKFSKLLPLCHTVIISGTKAAGFYDNLYPEMVNMAKQEKKIVILDVKGNDLVNSLKYKPDVIKPNFSEFISTFFPWKTIKEQKLDNSVINEIKLKMLEINKKYKSKVILTRGKFSTLYTYENSVKILKPEKISAINTTGCGDAFTAGFVSIFSKNRDLEESIIKGHECAKINALTIKPGSVNMKKDIT